MEKDNRCISQFWAVDKIEEDVVVVEALDTREIRKISLKDMSPMIKEKDIVFEWDSTWHIDEALTKKREEDMKKLFDLLRKNK